jgi:hypothetical protein
MAGEGAQELAEALVTIVASRSGALPATEAQVRAIEVRGPGGELLRKVTSSQADELVQRGHGEWRRASNGRGFVSLRESIAGGSPRGWLSRNGRTTRKVRIRNANGEAVSAPVITEHRGLVE